MIEWPAVIISITQYIYIYIQIHVFTLRVWMWLIFSKFVSSNKYLLSIFWCCVMSPISRDHTWFNDDAPCCAVVQTPASIIQMVQHRNELKSSPPCARFNRATASNWNLPIRHSWRHHANVVNFVCLCVFVCVSYVRKSMDNLFRLRICDWNRRFRSL